MAFDVILARDAQHPSVAVVTVDNPPVNAMSPGVPGAVLARLREAQEDGEIAALLLMAGGRGSFAGADIKMQGKPWPEAEPKMSDLVMALDASALPVGVLLEGYAFGGALEMAMACRYRIATPGTKLGQPEVKLGIPPGAGGTQRLPRLIGVAAALDMIVSGDPIEAERGRDLGLVDLLAAGADPVGEAAAFLAEQVAGGLRPTTRERTIAAVDPEIFAAARSKAARRYRGQTAPQVCIDCVEAATRLPFEEGRRFERQHYEERVISDEAAALRHVFFSERKIGRLPDLAADTPTRPLDQAAVVGAGTMGAGIAMCFANAGIAVRLIEREQAALERGLARVQSTYADLAKRGRLSEEAAANRKALISGGLSLADIAESDIVVEAVFEDMAVKQAVFAELAPRAKPQAILATNTSYLDVNEIAAAATGRSADVLGLHFFSPANIMPLLEIVRGDATSPEVLATAVGLAKRLGKTGIVAGVCQGFIANRMFEKYTREAEFLLQEGAAPEQVDKALVDFGMPMGPFAVRDLAGLDIGWARRKSVAHLRNAGARYSTVGDSICERGWFGQKTGRGFYRYEEGSRTPIPDPEVAALVAETAAAAGIARREIADEEIVARCLYAVVNEGARILEEGIALRASDVDLVWINGYGFPRWRGGPLFWAGQVGLADVLTRIRVFDEAHDFWQPADLLVALAEAGRTFDDWDKEKAP